MSDFDFNDAVRRTIAEQHDRMAALEAKNANLRELVLDYDKVLDAAVDVWGIMADALGYGRKYDSLHERAREMGIEVDE